VEILRLVGCEKLISQKKEFICNAFVYFQPDVEISEQEWCEKILALYGDSTSKRVLDVLEFFLSETEEDYSSLVGLQWVAVVKFRMNDRSGNGTVSFEVKDKDEDNEVHEYDNSKI